MGLKKGVNISGYPAVSSYRCNAIFALKKDNLRNCDLYKNV